MKNTQLRFKYLIIACLFLHFGAHAQKTKNPKQPEKTVSAPIQQKYSVFFDVGQHKIKSEGYKTLDSLVSLLQTNPNVRRIQVNGYADTTGGVDANMELSNKRTDTVSNYITGKGLMKFKVKFASAFFGEKVNGNESDLSQMRRVDVVLYLARPDRDTIIKSGCLSVKIKSNTFENFNNDELVFNIIYASTAEDLKKYNLSNLDTDGKPLLSGGMFKITATYKGKPVNGVIPYEINLPLANRQQGYSLYKGVEEKNKPVTWKNTGLPISGNRNNYQLDDLECYTVAISGLEFNSWHNVDQPLPCNYCFNDPFGGLQVPTNNNELAKTGSNNTIVLLNDQCFKKVDPKKAFFSMDDNLFPNNYPDFCTSLMYPGVGNVPNIPKFDREVVKYLDLNVSMKNDSADVIMMKKNKITVMIPKRQFPAHKGKRYALLPADTKKDNFWEWTNKYVLNDTCLGLANCDYLVFEVPFTGFYTLLELTPNNSKKSKSENENDSEEPQATNFVKVKSKKINNVKLYYGLKDEGNGVIASTFLKNKGKNSINQPKISKKDKKEFKNHVFLAYCVIGGKRYAWIGKGSQLKTNLFTGNWKTPKLMYIPDDQWEDFIRKACE